MSDLDTLLFFNEKPETLPLYDALEERISAEIRDVKIKVQKTQIAFANRHNFDFVSFLPVRKAKERPKIYITVTFGLSYKRNRRALMWLQSPIQTAGRIMFWFLLLTKSTMNY